jgi:hypothetical protein
MICWFDSELVWILDLYSATTCTFRPLRPVKGGRRCTMAQLLIFFKGEADESN